jgi:DNA-binding response OmpR family regulator
MRILIVEDEEKIARLLSEGLLEQGFAVELAATGHEGLHLATAGGFDAIVLDVMLPGLDGLSILRLLRERGLSTPVLLLTARGEVSERIEGLNLGADDYMGKPFAMDELIARLRALLRRASGEKLSFYKTADLVLNLTSRAVSRNGRKIELTAREFALLEFLMRSPGQVFTRTQIHERVWDYHFDPGTNLVDVYIQRLRRKIEEGEEPKLIQTVRGVGYSIQAPA